MAEISIYIAIKLRPILNYNRLRYSELADNILSHKLGDVPVFVGGKGLSLYPFDKVVGGNQK